jgi:hypothetical protein
MNESSLQRLLPLTLALAFVSSAVLCSTLSKAQGVNHVDHLSRHLGSSAEPNSATVNSVYPAFDASSNFRGFSIVASSRISVKPLAPNSDTVPLASGQMITESIPSPPPGTCILGETQYTIQVPAHALRLDISIREAGESNNIDLYMRLGKRVAVQEGKVVADFEAANPSTREYIQLPNPGSPQLQEGTYFIAVANCGRETSQFVLRASVTEALEPDTVEVREVGIFTGTVPAPQPDACTLGLTQYALALPEPSPCGPYYDYTIKLDADQNVKLYARLGHRVTTDENGNIISDKVSGLEHGSQVINLINFPSFDDPPDRFGIYYLAISNCGPGPATFRLAAGSPFIDVFPPSISKISLIGNALHVEGCELPFSSVIVVNGERQETVYKINELVAKKAGRKIAPGETVKIVLKTKYGRLGPYFFTRPPD